MADRILRPLAHVALAVIAAGLPEAALAASNDAIISVSRLNQTIPLGLNKSKVVDLPRDAHDIVVADPSVADAVTRTARRIYLFGKAVGQTNIFVFDAAGREIAVLDLKVERDIAGLAATIRRFIPTADVKAEMFERQCHPDRDGGERAGRRPRGGSRHDLHARRRGDHRPIRPDGLRRGEHRGWRRRSVRCGLADQSDHPAQPDRQSSPDPGRGSGHAQGDGRRGPALGRQAARHRRHRRCVVRWHRVRCGQFQPVRPWQGDLVCGRRSFQWWQQRERHFRPVARDGAGRRHADACRT